MVLQEVLRGVFNLIFTTSLAAFALSGFMATAIPSQPAWTSDYRTALSAASEYRKPIAVFITKGSQAQLTKGEGLSADAAKLIKDGYVALHVDTTTEKGQKLAKSFDLAEGLIISDKTGGVQALRHAGTVTSTELNGYLAKYAGAEPVTTTDYRTTGQADQPAFQPQYAPAYRTYAPPVYGARGSCPNCR
jgi:hypothetical protein